MAPCEASQRIGATLMPITALGILLLAFSGFGALALGMSRHSRVAMPHTMTERSGIFRSLGCSLLTASVMPVWFAANPAEGLVVWFGVLSIAGCLVVLLITYRPKLLKYGVVAAAVVALVVFLLEIRLGP